MRALKIANHTAEVRKHRICQVSACSVCQFEIALYTAYRPYELVNMRGAFTNTVRERFSSAHIGSLLGRISEWTVDVGRPSVDTWNIQNICSPVNTCTIPSARTVVTSCVQLCIS